MRSSIYRKISYFLIFIILFILSINLLGLFIHTDQDFTKIQKYGILNTAGTEPRGPFLWNPIATYPWYPDINGDPSDVFVSTSPTQGDLTIIGDSGIKQVILNTATQSSWKPFNKSDLVVVPNQGYGVDDDGVWCSHNWNENTDGHQPQNTPEMYWRTNVSLPVDMSDYKITDVSFNAIINASVWPNVDTPGDIQARFDYYDTIDQYRKYDFIQFYVEITTLDIDVYNTYEIGFNQTRLLGNESLSLYDIEGQIGAYGDQAIKDALTNVLAADPGHNNFTVLTGIYIYCEDNVKSADRDTWEEIRFKSLNLTFTYEKKIDQFTAVSWNQDLDEVNGTNVRITDANLEFKYKLDQNWTESSQNSQIRVYVNDRKYDDEPPIILIDYVYSTEFEVAQYNITSKLLPYENFTLSIQVYLAEDFELDHNITISITDVYLNISYTETFPDSPVPIPEPWVFFALLIAVSTAAVCLGGYFIAYQRILKYPRPVRKVRKFKRTLNKSSAPDVAIMPRDVAFKKSYNRELGASSKLLRLKHKESKEVEVGEKGELTKLTDESLGKKLNSDKLINQSLEKKGELDKLVDKQPEKPEP
ncbi:MAG: hypothetical protein JSV23_03315 [Promethearchaeota archaeon]|nr:MAG: hypothetical protein JSV23_03315 [Candidatus Lokiarchaeota archaeon]